MTERGPEPRTMTQLAEAMRQASRPDGEGTLTLYPGDHRAISMIAFMVDWLQTNGACQASYRSYVRERIPGEVGKRMAGQ